METKRNKYDTNPLDPNVAKDAEERWDDSGSGPVTQPVKGPTRQVTPPEINNETVYSEAPTRRYNKAALESSYPSVFVPPTYSPPVTYQPTPLVAQPGPVFDRSRSVAGIGLPEKWATMLPYAPFIGIVVAIVELLAVPRHEGKVRFFAAQGLALHVAILAFQAAFGLIGAITNTSVGGGLFKFAAFVFLIISMIRVWRGAPHHITALSEPTKWFNDKIGKS